MTGETTLRRAQQAVQESADGLYGVVLEKGSMQLGYYRPTGVDEQSPHQQDEIYVVQTGTGTLIRDDERITFVPGDALFVAAGVEHRFVDFSDDLGTWVIFYGAKGGEE